MLDIVPTDSRYVPLTQQPWCCVPTCIQMVLYKLGLPLRPAEDIGYHLGLTVKPERARLFYNARTSELPPRAGYGTQIYLPEYDPNVAFEKLGLPVRFSTQLISTYASTADLLTAMEQLEASNGDALLCFNYGALSGQPDKDWGHVVVFDRIVDGLIRIVDPSPDAAKWQLIKPEAMFGALKTHGDERSGGIWILAST